MLRFCFLERRKPVNIHLQLCGLIIVLFMLILYRSHKTLDLMGEKIFLQVLRLTVLCIALDMLSVVAIHYRDHIPDLLMRIACKAYLISMVWVGWGNFSYVSLDLNNTNGAYRRMTRIMIAATFFMSIVIAMLPIDVYDQNGELYSFGPSVIATYIFTIFYILSTLLVAVYITKKKNSRRGMAVLLTTTLWIIAALIQFLNNELLLVGFSMAVGTMILYIVLENPDSNLDRTLGCFNSYALYNYLDRMMAEEKPFGILDLSITDVEVLEERGLIPYDAARKIINGINWDKDVNIFKNFSTGLIAVSPDREKLDKLSALVMKMLSEYDNVRDAVVMFIANDVQQFGTTGELLKFMTYIRNSGEERLASAVYVSRDMIREYRDRQRIEAEIAKALEEDRVEVFLQPICDVAEKRPVSAEALVRIRNKDGSLLSPGVFIPVAEATGQINMLGESVLKKVCAFLRDSEVTELGIHTIHVNLSAVQCDSNSTVGRLSRIVEDYGIDPGHINFEITETAVSKARDSLVENMNSLIAKGFRFALDDFGKGESNLMYIVDMPVELIKLDMDMTKAFFSSAKAETVVGAVSDMANKLGLPIVAEGVESRDEADRITKEGIRYIQGYYYSRPLPMDEFIRYVKEYSHEDAAGETAGNQKGMPYDGNTAAEPCSDGLREKSGDSTGGRAAGGEDRLCCESVVNISGNRILLVEDNELSAEITCEILEDMGYTVDTAGDGIEALRILSDSVPGDYSLVLMDIRMPIMDGYEASRRIRSLGTDEPYDVPIIALTAQDSEEDRRAALEAGMNEHMKKPLNPEIFSRMVRRLSLSR